MKRKNTRTDFFKGNPIGKPFDKGKFIEEKLELLSDMDIVLTEREMEMLCSFNTPRKMEVFVNLVITSRWKKEKGEAK
jgi:hypothetical protein